MRDEQFDHMYTALQQSHSRETMLNRQIFDTRNQNTRLRAAIADAKTTMCAAMRSREDFVVAIGMLANRLDTVLRREDNI